jgi:hypothetical protein
MYALYPLGSIANEPEALWLFYGWSSFENREWRACVEHFLQELADRGHEIALAVSPPFTPGEDDVEMVYLVDGVRTAFVSDHLLSLIIITSADPLVLHRTWNSIGKKMGWVRQ